MTNIAHFNGQLLQLEKVSISPLDRGFIFGDGVYEVIPVYEGAMLRGREHFERLQRSMDEIRLANPHTTEEWLRLVEELLKHHPGNQSVYIQVTRGAAPRTHYFPVVGTPSTLLVMAGRLSLSDARFNGTSVITQPDNRWLRCDLKTVQLLPNVLARQAATEAGASEAIFVRDGVITEGTHTTVFAVIEGVLRTHPANHLVLPGVTREVVMEVARGMGFEVREQGVSVSELPNVSELFLTGTTTDVTPVVRVDGNTVGTGSPGPVARALLDGLLERMRTQAGALSSAHA